MKLVLLPGLDGTGVLFRPFVTLLTAQQTGIEPVVLSYPTRKPLGYDDLLPQIMGMLPREPFVLLGESFGGPLSLRIAAAAPSGLQALILAASFVTCPYRWAPSWMAPLIVPFPFRLLPTVTRALAALGCYATPEHFALSMESLTQVAPEVFAHRVREIVRCDATAELRACRIPILYLQGIYDRVVGPANLQRIRRLKPAIHTARIASGHMILKTQPQAALRAIEQFLAHLVADRSGAASATP